MKRAYAYTHIYAQSFLSLSQRLKPPEPKPALKSFTQYSCTHNGCTNTYFGCTYYDCTYYGYIHYGYILTRSRLEELLGARCEHHAHLRRRRLVRLLLRTTLTGVGVHLLGSG